MKLALSIYKDGISTVFDAADELLIMEPDIDMCAVKTQRRFSTHDPVRRASELKAWGIGVLICGAISRPMEAAIVSQGIEVVSFVRGTVENVIEAYRNSWLGQADFFLPGCIGRGSERISCCAGKSEAAQIWGQGRRCRRRLKGKKPQT